MNFDSEAHRVGEQKMKMMLPIGFTHLIRRQTVTARLKSLYRRFHLILWKKQIQVTEGPLGGVIIDRFP